MRQPARRWFAAGLAAVLGVLAIAPSAYAGDGIPCTSRADCVAAGRELCIRRTDTNMTYCCPGQGCAIVDGGASCVSTGACVVVDGPAGSDAGREAGSADAATADASGADAGSGTTTSGCRCSVPGGGRAGARGVGVALAALGAGVLAVRRRRNARAPR